MTADRLAGTAIASESNEDVEMPVANGKPVGSGSISSDRPTALPDQGKAISLPCLDHYGSAASKVQLASEDEVADSFANDEPITLPAGPSGGLPYQETMNKFSREIYNSEQ